MGRQDQIGAADAAERDAYGPIIQKLNSDLPDQRSIIERLQPRYQMIDDSRPHGGFVLDRDAIWRDVKAARAANPDFMKNIPVTDDTGFRAWVAQGEKASRLRAQSIVARERGAGQAVAGFGADLLTGMTDPINLGVMLATGGASGPTKTLAQVMARDALINGVTEAVETPIIAGNRARFDEDYGVGDAAKDIALAAGAGAAFGGVVHGGAKLIDHFTGKADGEVADAFKAAVPPEQRTPDQAAALHVIERQGQIAADNPFARDPAGMQAHADRLNDAMGRIERTLSTDNEEPPAWKPSTPARSWTPEEAIDAARAAIGLRESGGDYSARNRLSSAFGKYQFTDASWLGIGREINPAASAADIAAMRADPAAQEAFMGHALQDYSRQLQASGASVTPGNIYLLHFLGTKRGLEVLHADPATPIARLVGDAAIEANPRWLKGKTAGELVADMAARGGDAEHPLPVLDRARFADDESWRAAQEEADAEALSPRDRATAEAEFAADAEPIRRAVATDAAFRLRPDAEVVGAPPPPDDIAQIRAEAQPYDHPDTPISIAHMQSVEHDLRMAAAPQAHAAAMAEPMRFRLEPDGPDLTIDEALAPAHSDLDAVAKARACLAPPTETMA